MPKHFEYLPLHTDRNEIRLLTILPSTRTASTIRCSLKTVSLDDNPSFEAISYVWGDTSKKTKIIIDDTTFHVSLSVDRNLRLLRHKLQRRVVWIDYVCINQHDVLEKNTQVPLLGRVYASASAVVSIMVADNKNTRAAISWIKSFEQGVITWQAVESRILRYMSKYSQKLRDLEDRRLATLHDKILAIRDDPYWTRMWTYQEYQLAKSDPIGMSGRLTFDADLMVTLAEHRSILERWIGRGFRQIFSGRYRQNEIGKLRGLYGSRGRYRDESVLYHFRQTSHRQCKDPRDKVYALYSLLPSLQAQYPPEYKKSSGQVMHETTAYTLRKEGLEILNLFRLLGDRFSTCWTYPSWVLDLTSPTEHESDLFVAYNWWSSHQKLIPAITDDLSTMTIWARCISVRFPVLQLGSTMPDIIKQLVEVADVHNKSWGGLECRLISLMHACLDFSDLEVDFGRDPCTKAKEIFDFLQRIADQGTHSIDDPLWKELCDVFPANAGKTILDIHDSVVKGFAISGPDVRPGDVAVMDSGLPAPLILRPYHDDGELYYRLVDIAYIPLMSKRPRLNGTFDYLRYLERPPQVFSVR